LAPGEVVDFQPEAAALFVALSTFPLSVFGWSGGPYSTALLMARGDRWRDGLGACSRKLIAVTSIIGLRKASPRRGARR